VTPESSRLMEYWCQEIMSRLTAEPRLIHTNPNISQRELMNEIEKELNASRHVNEPLLMNEINGALNINPNIDENELMRLIDRELNFRSHPNQLSLVKEIEGELHHVNSNPVISAMSAASIALEQQRVDMQQYNNRLEEFVLNVDHFLHMP